MPFHTPDEREGKVLFEGIVARTFWGANVMLAVVNIDARGVVPSHSHPHEQAGMVLEGELTFTIDDESRVLRAGDVYVIPGDVEHGAVAGDTPCKVLDIFSPVRDEYKY